MNPATAQPADPRTVLLVDDEFLIRWSISETLRRHGYDIVEASDARTARAAVAAAAHPFEVIVLDLQLPDMRDFTLLKSLHERSSAPIVMMTAHGTRELAHEARALGAYAFLNKPFELDDLATVVRHASAGAAV